MTISKDTSAPLVVVVAATGLQGRSVIDALEQSDRPYRIRGFTRDPSKPAAQELAAQGVELVTIDPVPERKEDVQKAFKGADIVFVSYLADSRPSLESQLLPEAAFHL